MKISVFITSPNVPGWDFSEANAARLVELLPDSVVDVCADETQFLSSLADAEIALVWHFRQEWFAYAPRLRLISTPSAGRDYFRIAPPENVRVMYGAFHGQIMGETAAALVLGMSRGVLLNGHLMAASHGVFWPQENVSRVARRLRGAHVVILGFGHIGETVGAMLKPFGVRVTGIKRDSATPRPKWFSREDKIVSVDALDDVLPDADHLVCVLPGDTNSAGLLDARRLALLPPHAYFYNLGRGSVVDENALAAALREGWLAGAALDVFCEEPLPADSPLRTTPNTCLLPHASAISTDYLDLYVAEFAERMKHG